MAPAPSDVLKDVTPEAPAIPSPAILPASTACGCWSIPRRWGLPQVRLTPWSAPCIPARARAAGDNLHLPAKRPTPQPRGRRGHLLQRGYCERSTDARLKRLRSAAVRPSCRQVGCLPFRANHRLVRGRASVARAAPGRLSPLVEVRLWSIPMARALVVRSSSRSISSSASDRLCG